MKIKLLVLFLTLACSQFLSCENTGIESKEIALNKLESQNSIVFSNVGKVVNGNTYLTINKNKFLSDWEIMLKQQNINADFDEIQIFEMDNS